LSNPRINCFYLLNAFTSAFVGELSKNLSAAPVSHYLGTSNRKDSPAGQRREEERVGGRRNLPGT
jgi:hypothetical protein